MEFFSEILSKVSLLFQTLDNLNLFFKKNWKTTGFFGKTWKNTETKRKFGKAEEHPHSYPRKGRFIDKVMSTIEVLGFFNFDFPMCEGVRVWDPHSYPRKGGCAW